MRRAPVRFAAAVTAFLVVVLLVSVAGQNAPPLAARIALTFDDLPVHGPLPPGTSRTDVARRIVETLSRHKVPEAYGFVNAKALEEDPAHAEVLRLRRAAGFPFPAEVIRRGRATAGVPAGRRAEDRRAGLR